MPQKVSVIISTYNRARYIADAIRSVQAQTHRDVEIIVADDGSTDNTAEIVARFGDAVVYLPLPHRGQPAATRNGGLRVATGAFVSFLDSDDSYTPDKLAVQVAALESHPETGLAYSNGYFFRDDPQVPAGHVLDGLPTPTGDALPELLRGNFLTSPTVLIRRSCVEAVGLFDERPEFFAVEDYDLWLRIAAQFEFVYAPGDVAAIRRHVGSISRDVAVLRRSALLALTKLEEIHPLVRTSHAAALNEGYARHHGAIALAHLQRGQLLGGLGSAFQALRYSLRTPGIGSRALFSWLRRRRVRGTAARS